MRSVGEIIASLDRFAPPELAADWDNVGLLLGNRASDVQRVMTCLTVTPEVAQEVTESKAQLLIAHHPLFFHPVQRLTADTPEGRTILSLIQSGTAVYSPHTSFDNTLGGINDLLAERL